MRREKQLIAWPESEWTVSRIHDHDGHGERIFDVIIIGGGQCGLAVAYGLKRDSVICHDENEPGREGPWMTYARMVTLRTPKALNGLDYGLPSLCFQSYYEARFGQEAWVALDKIPKAIWMDYLIWYRTVLDIPVLYNSKCDLIEPLEPYGQRYQLNVIVGGVPRAMFARKVGLQTCSRAMFEHKVSRPVPYSSLTSHTCSYLKDVLATGIQGGGEWHVPSFIPKSMFAHTSDPSIDGLKGKRIAILVGGASDFDSAQFALERGVGEVHVFVRRPELPRINPIRFMELAGFLKHLCDDDTKYAGIDFFLQFNQPPTNDTFARAAKFNDFTLHTDSSWDSLAEEGGQVRVTSKKGDEGLFDFLIVSTGLVTDVRLRPELRSFAEKIATWGDCCTPKTPRNPIIDAHPYLTTILPLLR